MNRYKKLMVALDRSGNDAGLIQYAAGIVRLGTVSEVCFAHVLADESESREAALRDLETAVRLHGAEITAVSVSRDVLHGPLTDALLAHAAEKHTDLLLVGHRTEPGNRKPLARRLAMQATCSVWMVPAGAPATVGRILVPIDFSEMAADSLQVAASIARLHGAAECFALHVYFNEAVATYEGYDSVLRGEEEKEYERFAASIDLQGVSVTPLFNECAIVSHAIAREASRVKADLIVMATRGRSRSSSILLGSVTERMIDETHLPLLAVKHFGAQMNVLEALLDRRFREKGELRAD
jgi:nucleotide-binding universal stress UspA family protein